MSEKSSPKQQFLDTYEKEHQTTMKVLRAYPADKMELRPHAKCKTARELAFVFAVECGLGALAMRDELGKGGPMEMPPTPESWDDVLAAVEQAHQDFGNLIRSYSEDDLMAPVKFFSGPQQLGDWPRLHLLWHLLHDEIHHRGQFSIYLRMADGKVPSIYGPSADEPWM